MTKILVYSHDTFGLGNIRRMLAICTHLLEASPNVSILLVTGSPLIHNFRLPERLDYIKLPSLTRIDRDSYCTKYLDIDLDVSIRLRSGLILNAVAAFCPDLIMVDKKPLGIKSELKSALAYVKKHHPHTRTMLILRDILDGAESTVRTWRNKGYYDVISRFYDRIAILGSPEIFDACREYRLPQRLIEKTQFCGYIRREPARRGITEIRRELNLREGEPFILVTAGGGEDSSCLMEAYLGAVPLIRRSVPHFTSLLVHGPAIPEAVRLKLQSLNVGSSKVILRDFTDDLMSYLAAADAVISMGGYNTICELLTLGKRAVIVPRVRPVQEQYIRAERMERLGLFRVVHPDKLTPAVLANTLVSEINFPAPPVTRWVDMNALERIADMVRRLQCDSGAPTPPAPEHSVAADGALTVEAI